MHLLLCTNTLYQCQRIKSDDNGNTCIHVIQENFFSKKLEVKQIHVKIVLLYNIKMITIISLMLENLSKQKINRVTIREICKMEKTNRSHTGQALAKHLKNKDPLKIGYL